MQWLKKLLFKWFFQEEIEDLYDDCWIRYPSNKIRTCGQMDAYIDLLQTYGDPPKIYCDDCERKIPQRGWPEYEEYDCEHCQLLQQLVDEISNKNLTKE